MASVKEMRAAAKARGVKGYYKMNKSQLMAVVGGGTNTKSGATGNKRAQGIAKKSGAAVSFGADKLAAKYGVDKKTLVSGTRKALRKAEKANGAPLTPQQKRKVAAQHLSGATKIDRNTSGMMRKMKRESPQSYNRTALSVANLKSGSGARKKGVSMLMDIEKGTGKRSRSKAAREEMTESPAERKREGTGAKRRKAEISEMDGRSKSSKQVKRNLAKTKMMRQLAESTGVGGGPKSRINARFTKNSSARLGNLLASSRSAPGNASSIKNSRKLSREMGLPDQMRMAAKPKRGGRKAKK